MKISYSLGLLALAVALAAPSSAFAQGRGRGQEKKADQQADQQAQNDTRQMRFRGMDTDNDGVITRREWTGNRASFDRMDRNHDVFISRNEFLDFTLERPVGTSGSQAQTRAYQAGYQKGLEEGRQAGREDKNVNGGKWDLEGQRELEQADSGYRTELGARSDYQAGYRAGFRLAYREGFGPRH